MEWTFPAAKEYASIDPLLETCNIAETCLCPAIPAGYLGSTALESCEYLQLLHAEG
jgi:hypothetical protein